MQSQSLYPDPPGLTEFVARSDAGSICKGDSGAVVCRVSCASSGPDDPDGSTRAVGGTDRSARATGSEVNPSEFSRIPRTAASGMNTAVVENESENA